MELLILKMAEPYFMTVAQASHITPALTCLVRSTQLLPTVGT